MRGLAEKIRRRNQDATDELNRATNVSATCAAHVPFVHLVRTVMENQVDQSESQEEMEAKLSGHDCTKVTLPGGISIKTTGLKGTIETIKVLLLLYFFLVMMGLAPVPSRLLRRVGDIIMQAELAEGDQISRHNPR